jgi:ribosomal protein S18 acetylase RimI-like enzyme
VVTRRGRWKVSTARSSEQRTWRRLYRAYGEEAGYVVSDEHLSRVWSWIMRRDGQTNCLLLRRSTAPDAVGLAHFRTFERPITGSIGCYLDDLFVDSEQRGHGGARALLEHLAGLAGESGWTTVRWTTRPSNPAQSLYDSVAARNPVITFDMDPRVG